MPAVIQVFHWKELVARNLLLGMQVFGTDSVAITGALLEITARRGQ